MESRVRKDLDAKGRKHQPALYVDAMLAGMRDAFGTAPENGIGTGTGTGTGTDQTAAELVLQLAAIKKMKTGHNDDELVSVWNDVRRMTYQAMIAGVQDALKQLSGDFGAQGDRVA